MEKPFPIAPRRFSRRKMLVLKPKNKLAKQTKDQ